VLILQSLLLPDGMINLSFTPFADSLSALMLLVGHQEEYSDCKKLSDEVLVFLSGWLPTRSKVQ